MWTVGVFRGSSARTDASSKHISTQFGMENTIAAIVKKSSFQGTDIHTRGGCKISSKENPLEYWNTESVTRSRYTFEELNTITIDTRVCGTLEARQHGDTATIEYVPGTNVKVSRRIWYHRRRDEDDKLVYDSYSARNESSRYHESEVNSKYELSIRNITVNDSGDYLVNCGENIPGALTTLFVNISPSSSTKKVTEPFVYTGLSSSSATNATITKPHDDTQTSTKAHVEYNAGKDKTNNIANLIGPVVAGAAAIVVLVIVIAVFILMRNNKKIKTKRRQYGNENITISQTEQNRATSQTCTLQQTRTGQQVRPVSQESNTAFTEYARVSEDVRTHENELTPPQNINAGEDVPEYSFVVKKKRESHNSERIPVKMDNEQETPEYSCVVKKKMKILDKAPITEKMDANDDTDEISSFDHRKTEPVYKKPCNKRNRTAKKSELVYVELDLSNRPASRTVNKEYEATEYVSIDIEKTAKMKHET